MVSFVFPGQGSQVKGMGQDLFDDFKELTQQADEILGYSIKELCLENKEGKLNQTQYTQPALFVVNAMSYLREKKNMEKTPDFLAGHSLGEFNALFASGVFDFRTGLKIVQKRGQLMSQATGGGMAAVVGLSETEIRNILIENNINTIEIANYNEPEQHVISGIREDIVQVQKIFEQYGAKHYIILNVSGAFHSRFMQEAKDEFSTYLKQFTLATPHIPVISNVTARPYTTENLMTNIMEQMVKPVRWTDSVRYMMAIDKEIEIKQIGPGNTLAGLIRKIRKTAQPLILEEEGNKGFNQQVDQERKVDPETERSSRIIDEKTQEKQVHRSILGNESFLKDYKTILPYYVGGLYKGVTSSDMICTLSRAGILGFFGTGGLQLEKIEKGLLQFKNELDDSLPYGVSITHQINSSETEDQIVNLLLQYGISVIEAVGYMNVTSSLAKYRIKGLREKNGRIVSNHRLIAKVTRPEVAEAFLSPVPQNMIETLLQSKAITEKEAEWARHVPMCDDLCVLVDSGFLIDGGGAFSLLPAIKQVKERKENSNSWIRGIRVGVSGGIGSPQAIAGAFLLGADFVSTCSINQCTVEANISPIVKESLQRASVQDIGFAPMLEMFELGAKTQVLKRENLFLMRANKLYDLYRKHSSIHDIDRETLEDLEQKIFKKSVDQIWEECYEGISIEAGEKINQNEKLKMAVIFKWYLDDSISNAIEGKIENKMDFQIRTSSAIGSFNQWVKGTTYENWQNRHVHDIAITLMKQAEEYVRQEFLKLAN